jgi:hypothetical protein
VRFLCVFAAVSTLQATACLQRSPWTDADQVYRAVLDSLYFQSPDSPTVLVAWPRTDHMRVEYLFGYRWRLAEILPAELIRGFVQANQFDSVITRFRAVSQPQLFIDRTQWEPIFGRALEAKTDGQLWNEAWASFMRRYPGASGYVSVSKIGFDWTHSRALVQVDWHGGWLAAWSALVLVERRWRGWKVTRVFFLIVV